VAPVRAQDTPAREPAQSSLAEQVNDPTVFLKVARTLLKWDEPAAPTHIVGPVYFVGTRGLASFLITGSEGHVLMYTGMPGSGPLIEQSITKLGFKPTDVKIILTGHAHCDHCGGHAYLKKVTGAKIAMMEQEVPLFESGGKLDFQYGSHQEFGFEPAKVDVVMHDGEEIKLGDIALKALLTPGHTKGSTTHVMEVVDRGKTYTVVFPDGTSINPGYRLVANPSYPGIAEDFGRTFAVLDRLKPDIWFNPHNEMFGYEAKLARAEKEGAAAWVDPEGYRQFVARQKAKFDSTVAMEGGDKSAPAGDD
jgi:metallo-beta-lactamase class B